jgi:hypothetical protein
VNMQDAKGKAKPYQVRQLLDAIDKLVPRHPSCDAWALAKSPGGDFLGGSVFRRKTLGAERPRNRLVARHDAKQRHSTRRMRVAEPLERLEAHESSNE